MSWTPESLVSVGIVVLLLFLFRGLLRRRPRPGELERRLPRQLAGAQIVLQEETLEAPELGLVARPDRCYRVGDERVLVEFKTRFARQTYEDDRIELSVQRVVLEHCHGEPVSRNAWIVIENPSTGQRQPLTVRLLERGEVLALRDRYLALVSESAQTPPRAARSARQCQQCGHLRRCQATFGDRLSELPQCSVGVVSREASAERSTSWIAAANNCRPCDEGP